VTHETEPSVMKAIPTDLSEANAFVAKYHRHSLPTVGHKFSVGVAVRGERVGVAICGRPVARMIQDGFTLEVLRVCVVDGVSDFHVCSNLYGRCVRIARDQGYRRVVTYTLASESGASLKAAGFKPVAEVAAAATWSVPSRRREQTIRTLFGDIEKRNTGAKVRWERQV